MQFLRELAVLYVLRKLERFYEVLAVFLVTTHLLLSIKNGDS